MAKKFTWSEVFTSIEGEGPLSGEPTTYIRFARCNFTCGGFNNPNNQIDDNGYAILPFDPSNVNKLSDVEPIEIGCDSQYSVNPAFKHIWTTGNTDQLVDEVMKVLPNNQWKHPITKLSTNLSLTGGEPTLAWKTIPELLNHPNMSDVTTIIIETNCAVPFNPIFIEDLNKWVSNKESRQIVWANSPKLANSGEPQSEAINPNIAIMQQGVSSSTQYFKFVCGSEEDFDKVDNAMEIYYSGGIDRAAPVYIMPEACTEYQQDNIAELIADLCIQRGRIYCHRIHNSVYANAIGK